MNNEIDIPVSSPVSRGEPTARSTYSANQRVLNLMGHAIGMLSQLKQQHEGQTDELGEIYKVAEEKIYNLNSEIQNRINQPSSKRGAKIDQLQKALEAAEKELKRNQEEVNYCLVPLGLNVIVSDDIKNQNAERLKNAQARTTDSHEKVNSLQKQLDNAISNLSNKEIKDLAKEIEAAEEEIVKIIRDTRIKVASEIGAAKFKNNGGTQSEENVATVRSKIATLARDGWGAKLIYFLSFVLTINAVALECFKESQEAMQLASKLGPAQDSEASQVEKDKYTEFQKGNLDRRAGVIGLNGMYRFDAVFSKEQIHEQFKSFSVQNISQIERKTIERKIGIEEKSFTSKIIPLNKEFDKYMGMSGVLTEVFTMIFGTRGISSANRQEPHLINGWETNLIQDDKTIFRSLRHAILSDKYEENPEVRAQNSKQATYELIKAALLEELKTQGRSIEEAKKYGITLNLNSVSLVTPDDVRPYLPGQANEKQMLLDQVLALQSFNDGNQIIELDGVEIKVKVNVNAFNFGVNILADTLKWGLGNQYEHNVKAMKGFRNHVAKFYKSIKAETKEIKEQLKTLKTDQNAKYQELEARKKALKTEKDKANHLMNDIELLMKDKEAYLKGDNQYEIGAKILNLNHLMDQTIETINQTQKDQKRIHRISGFKSAFNCMSGKDRTGWMDAVAKTFAIMAASSKEGYYPSHAEFMKNPERRKEFAKILEKVVLEAGNLEITEINTGAKGYKMQGDARLFGMSAEIFLLAQGISSTTAD